MNKFIFCVVLFAFAVNVCSQSVERVSFPQVVFSNDNVSAVAGSPYGISLTGARGSMTITSEYGDGDFHNEIVSEEGHLVLENGIYIYPNPVDFIVNIVFDDAEAFDKCKQIDIYDIGGRLALSKPITSFAPEIAVDVSQIPQGTYIIRACKNSVKMIKR